MSMVYVTTPKAVPGRALTVEAANTTALSGWRRRRRHARRGARRCGVCRSTATTAASHR